MGNPWRNAMSEFGATGGQPPRHYHPQSRRLQILALTVYNDMVNEGVHSCCKHPRSLRHQNHVHSLGLSMISLLQNLEARKQVSKVF